MWDSSANRYWRKAWETKGLKKIKLFLIISIFVKVTHFVITSYILWQFQLLKVNTDLSRKTRCVSDWKSDCMDERPMFFLSQSDSMDERPIFSSHNLTVWMNDLCFPLTIWQYGWATYIFLSQSDSMDEQCKFSSHNLTVWMSDLCFPLTIWQYGWVTYIFLSQSDSMDERPMFSSQNSFRRLTL